MRKTRFAILSLIGTNIFFALNVMAGTSTKPINNCKAVKDLGTTRSTVTLPVEIVFNAFAPEAQIGKNDQVLDVSFRFPTLNANLPAKSRVILSMKTTIQSADKLLDLTNRLAPELKDIFADQVFESVIEVTQTDFENTCTHSHSIVSTTQVFARVSASDDRFEESIERLAQELQTQLADNMTAIWTMSGSEARAGFYLR